MVNRPRTPRCPFPPVHLALISLLVAWLALAASHAHAGLKPEFTLHRPAAAQFFFDFDDGGARPDRIIGYGDPGDVGLLADMDGDTIADLILYRDGVWFVDLRNDGTVDQIFLLGDPSGPDIPVVGDFLGTGKAGIGVFRNGTWFLKRDPTGPVDHISVFGASGDVPVVADFDGDGRADRAVYRNGLWFVDLGFNGTLDRVYGLGGLPQDIPFAGDFDGDWRADIGVFRDGAWFVNHSGDQNGLDVPEVNQAFIFGAAGDRPLMGPINPGGALFVRQGAVGGNGSQAAPLGTIAAAAGAAPNGMTIRIAAGTYPEGLTLSNRSNLTFVGAGVNATHVTGAGGDGFVGVLSQNITFRNLRVGTANGRAIVAQGASLVLDRVSTIGNRNHNVLGVNFGVTGASLVIDSSNIDTSQIGNGLRLEGGVVATVRRTTIDRNGTAPGINSLSGRGAEVFGNSVLVLEDSSVSQNTFGGLLFTNTSSATIRRSVINLNGHNGIYFEQSTSGDISSSVIDNNGIQGTRGPTTGFNGIEVAIGWSGPPMAIHENWIHNSTTNGVFIGASGVTVANNFFFNNFVGVTVFSGGPALGNVVVRGNIFELPLMQGNEEGAFLEGPVTVTLGGSGTNRNTFRNYLGNPAIHCIAPANAVCQAGGNAFENCDLANAGCSSTCSAP